MRGTSCDQIPLVVREAVEALTEETREKRRGTSVSLGAGSGVRCRQRLAISLAAKMAGGEERRKESE